MATTRDYIDYLNDQVDIAPANSQEELQAAQLIQQLMEEHGLDTRLQEFDAASGGELPYRLVMLLLVLGIVLAGFYGTPAAAVGIVLVLVCAALFLLRQLGYDFLTGLGRPARSQNVVGVHRAEGPLVVKGNRPIVIVAHYDTPRASFLYAQPLARFQPLIKRAAPICIAVASVLGVFQFFGFVPVVARRVLWVLGLIASLPLVMLGADAIYQRLSACTEGAVDNKASVAAMLGVLDKVRPGDDSATGYAKAVAEKRAAAPAPVEEGDAGADDAFAEVDDLELEEPAEFGFDGFDAIDDVDEPEGVEPPEAIDAYESLDVLIAPDDEELEPYIDDVVAEPSPAADVTVAFEVAPAVEPEKEAAAEPATDLGSTSSFSFVPSFARVREAEPELAEEEEEVIPQVVTDRYEEVVGVRHGESVIRSLRMLPTNCEIAYLEPELVSRSVRPQDDIDRADFGVISGDPDEGWANPLRRVRGRRGRAQRDEGAERGESFLAKVGGFFSQLRESFATEVEEEEPLLDADFEDEVPEDDELVEFDDATVLDGLAQIVEEDAAMEEPEAEEPVAGEPFEPADEVVEPAEPMEEPAVIAPVSVVADTFEPLDVALEDAFEPASVDEGDGFEPYVPPASYGSYDDEVVGYAVAPEAGLVEELEAAELEADEPAEEAAEALEEPEVIEEPAELLEDDVEPLEPEVAPVEDSVDDTVILDADFEVIEDEEPEAEALDWPEPELAVETEPEPVVGAVVDAEPEPEPEAIAAEAETFEELEGVAEPEAWEESESELIEPGATSELEPLAVVEPVEAVDYYELAMSGLVEVPDVPSAADEPDPEAVEDEARSEAFEPEPEPELEPELEAVEAEPEPTVATEPTYRRFARPLPEIFVDDDEPSVAEPVIAPGISFADEPLPSEDEIDLMDGSGLTEYVETTEAQVIEPAPKAAGVDDPSWGRSEFQPPALNVARRAALFDLPDPAVAPADPFGTDLGSSARRRSMHDDDSGSSSHWKGGATTRAGLRIVTDESLEEVSSLEDFASLDPQPVDEVEQEELRDAILSLGDDALISHDVWFVALGASELGHAGMSAFLREFRTQIRGAFLVNLDCVGAGELNLLTREGLSNSRRSDRRMTRMLAGIADDLHIQVERSDHAWEETDATQAMRKSVRSVTVMGLEDGVAALSHTTEDTPDEVDAAQASAVTAMVTELIRRA